MRKGEKMSKAQKEKLTATLKEKSKVSQTTNPFDTRNRRQKTGVKFDTDPFDVMNKHMAEIFKEEKEKLEEKIK